MGLSRMLSQVAGGTPAGGKVGYKLGGRLSLWAAGGRPLNSAAPGCLKASKQAAFGPGKPNLPARHPSQSKTRLISSDGKKKHQLVWVGDPQPNLSNYEEAEN